MGAQWLSGRVLDSRPRGRGFEPHRRHCVVSLSKNINPSLVLVQPRKTQPFITERLLMGRKESNQTTKNKTPLKWCFAGGLMMAHLSSLPSSTKKKKKKKKRSKLPLLTKLSRSVYACYNISHYNTDLDIAFLGSQTFLILKGI